MTELRIQSTLDGLSRGWCYTPLNGKRPKLRNWTDRDPATEAECVRYATAGNVGIRTGAVSGGLVVVDIDEGADISGLDLPDTVTVETGSGGLHLYYQSDMPIRNSAGKIAPHIDIRANGGQVVAVGSVHPVTGGIYHYLVPPTEAAVAPLPPWVIEALEAKAAKTTMPRATHATAPGYARSAMRYECERVVNAAEGTRNHELNAASFSLGTMVGAGMLSEYDASEALIGAGMQSGLTEHESRRTVASGLAAGIAKPRQAPQSWPPDVPAPPPMRTATVASPAKHEILIPGTHQTPDGYEEIPADRFVDEVIRNLPVGCLYRRGTEVVELAGDPGSREMRMVTFDRMRIIIDRTLRLVWMCKKNKRFHTLYKNCTKDLAALVLAYAGSDSRIRQITTLTRYPIYLDGWELAPPGWQDGVFYDESPELRGLEPTPPGEVFESLLVDFPFSSRADMENYLSLLITPMIRPALVGNVPLFLIKSALPRTGKTKLAEQVLGGVYIGEETPAMQWVSSEDERDKRILALLRNGDPILHIDNVAHHVDSPALASLVTSRYYQGRVLGQSEMQRPMNNMTIVATANNPSATGEIVKRTIPITLQPLNDSPELRDDFKHPRLFKYVLSRRRVILSAMIGMVEAWKSAGKPATKQKMGGFESWVAAVSGIMKLHGYNQWMANWRSWVRNSDPEGEDMRRLVKHWHAVYGAQSVSPADLVRLADEYDLFSALMGRAGNDHARHAAMRIKILDRYKNAPVGRYSIEKNDNQYVLEWRE